MSILRFVGARFKKAMEAVSKRGQISKKFWISHFFGSRQNLTPMQVEIKK